MRLELVAVGVDEAVALRLGPIRKKTQHADGLPDAEHGQHTETTTQVAGYSRRLDLAVPRVAKRDRTYLCGNERENADGSKTCERPDCSRAGQRAYDEARSIIAIVNART